MIVLGHECGIGKECYVVTRNAVVRKGQLVLSKPLRYADGTRVQVHLQPVEEEPGPRKKATTTDPLQFLADHAVETGISDLAEEHDHYIYGTPKRSS